VVGLADKTFVMNRSTDLPAPRGADDRHEEGQHVEGFHWRFGPVATSFQGGIDIRVPGAGGRRRNHLFSRL